MPEKIKYPRDWRYIQDSIRFERANRQCECKGECGKHGEGTRCGEVHGKPSHLHNGRVFLTVILRSGYHNFDRHNLIAVCERCGAAIGMAKHKEADAIERRRREKYQSQEALF